MLTANLPHVDVRDDMPPRPAEPFSIRLLNRPAFKAVTYTRLFIYGREKTLIYSVWDIAETLNHVWNRYVQ